MSDRREDITIDKINSIRCLEELDGYEAQARKRGLKSYEMMPLQGKRVQLTKGKRKP